MRHSSLRTSLKPRNGRLLRVIGVARISTIHQDERSLDDQRALYDRWLRDNYDGTYELRMISSRVSGEVLDRPELIELADLVGSRSFDLVITEDLGRIARRVHVVVICEDCIDADTRLIAINDRVDTAESEWRQNSIFATLRHESYNEDTGKRIKRSLTNRFVNGGVLRVPLFCYTIPNGAKVDTEMQKIPEMGPVIDGIFQRLEGSYDGTNWSYSRVADWLNESNVPLGRGVRRKNWNGSLVSNTVSNPLLKGVRVRNLKVSKRVHSTGRRRSVVADPSELIVRPAPHLAYVDADRYDRVIAMLKAKNAPYRAGKAEKGDSRKGRSKKRTRFPGQMIDCGICGRPFVFGGHGQLKHLMCSGATEYRCWNGITVDSDLAGELIPNAVFATIQNLPEFDATLREAIESEFNSHLQESRNRENKVREQLGKLEGEARNLINAVRQFGASTFITDELRAIESQKALLQVELVNLPAKEARREPLPSMAEIRAKMTSAFADLARDSVEFGDQMRRMIGRITVFPLRFCDTGTLGLRAEYKLQLSQFLPSTAQIGQFASPLDVRQSVDLIRLPQKGLFRERIVAMKAQGMSSAEIADRLGLTKTVVNWSLKLHKPMLALGLTDPIVILTNPPTGTRLRRHEHPRYRFEVA